MPLAPVREQLPAQARAHLEAAESELVYNPYATATWRLRRPGDPATRRPDCFLKAGWAGPYASLAAERDRTLWLAERGVPVPTVLDAGSEEGVEWMLTAALTGQPALRTPQPAAPARRDARRGPACLP